MPGGANEKHLLRVDDGVGNPADELSGHRLAKWLREKGSRQDSAVSAQCGAES